MEENHECYFHGNVPFKGAQMSVGAVLALNDQVIDELSGTVPYSGNMDRAHWEALIQGMELAAKNGVRRLIMKGDSRSVINVMNSQPTSRDFDSMDYYLLARKVQLKFDQCFFQWVPSEKNILAIRNSTITGAEGP
ncbi:MAG: reverse transcriptase-like protein [Thermoplasmatota archaeon]